MKKMCAALLALLLAFTVLGTALAQDSGRVSDEARALYDSRWFSENAYVDITPQDGEFKVQVRMGDSYEGGYCWEYSTVFNPETKRLETVRPAVKFRTAYLDQGGYDLVETIYEKEVKTWFELDDQGRLVWVDSEEDAGKGITFEKIGWFDLTVWACDRAVIRMYWEEEGYRVAVEWSSSAWENSVWEYNCHYHADENALVSLPFGIRTDYVYDDAGNIVNANVIYEDGQAKFFLDADGKLIWQDEKENAGDGMRFEETVITETVFDSEENG